MADIKYLITVDAAGAIKTMKEFDDTLDKTAKSSGTAENAHKGLWKQVAIGEIAYNAAVKAGRFMWEFLKDSATAAMEAEKADKALAAALEITGRPVQDLAKHFGDMATELQHSTVYEDEAIKKTQTLLLQLTNLDRDGIDKATKGTIGLASVMGMDLNSAAQLVAKAMSGNVSALTRYGIQVDQTKSKEDQRAEVMAKLEQFYGRATADTQTYGGQLAQLKNKYGDVQEAVGMYITKNTSLLKTLNDLADSTLYYLTLQDKLDQQVADSNKALHDHWKSIWDAAYAIGMESDAINELSKKHSGNIGQILLEIRHNKEFSALKEKMAEQGRSELKIWKEQEQARKKAEQGTNKVTEKTKDLVEEFKKQRKEQLKIIEATVDLAKTNTAILEPSLEGVTGELIDMSVALADVAEDAKGTFNYMIQAATEFWGKYGQTAMDVIYSVDALFYQSYKNKEIAMDNEYKKAVERIEKSKMNEEEKTAALAALDEQYEKKRSELKAKQAKQDKAMAIIQATVNTFEAATKTYAHFGWPLGAVFAGIMTAMGLALVAKIKAQPIPLAKGGIFDKPTLLSSMGGQPYQVAEAGEKEVVAPLSGLRRELGMDNGKRGQARPLQVQIYLDGKELKNFIVKTIDETSRIGKLRVAPKAVTL